MPSDLFGRLFLLFVCSFLLVSLPRVQSNSRSCKLPTEDEIADFLEHFMVITSDRGSSMSVTVLDHHYTCLAVYSKDRYRWASIAVHYTTSENNAETTEHMHQIQLRCIHGRFHFSDVGAPLEKATAEIMNVPTRTDCRVCAALSIDIPVDRNDKITNCLRKHN